MPAPTLRAVTPAVGAREGGAVLTITGGGFMRTTSLRVRFAAASPKKEVDEVPAQWVDSTTITVVAPPRDTPHVAQLTVTNDGSTYTALPLATNRGSGSYLTYEYVDHKPYGAWVLDNATFPAGGGGNVSVLLAGAFVDGAPEGGVFYDTDQLFCAFGDSKRRTFSYFTPVNFTDNGTATLASDMQLLLASEPREDYDVYASQNTTYQVVMASASAWRWRKFASGSYPHGSFSDLVALSTSPAELDLGVTVTFATAAGKDAGDAWEFQAVTRNPHVVPAYYLGDARRVTCAAPPYDAELLDVDPSTPGRQVELKISNRGNDTYSAVTFFNATDSRFVTGSKRYHAKGSTKEGMNQDSTLYVSGYYDTPAELEFELKCKDTGCTTVEYAVFKPSSVEREYKCCTEVTDGRWNYLERGVWVKWATEAGKRQGDYWTFSAKTFWSTPYSPVAFTDAGYGTSPEAQEMLVRGAYVGAESFRYEVQAQVNTLTVKWRKCKYGEGYTGACTEVTGWSEPLTITAAPIDVEDNIQIVFPVNTGKHYGDLWAFNAYAGHVVTYNAADYISAPVASAANAIGDPPLPATLGDYTGYETAMYELEVSGSCTTSCTHFRWRKNGGYWSNDVVMVAVGQSVADGVKVSWGPTSGWQKGNVYTVTAKPLPTTVMPSQPEMPATANITTNGTYEDGTGGAPAQDSVFTVEFDSGSSFVWRKDTGAFSQSIAIDTDVPHTLSDGLNVSFSAASGYTAGAKFLVPMKSHLPTVDAVVTDHEGSRAVPSLTQPVAQYENYLNLPNQGSLLGDVVPVDGKLGNKTVLAYPTPGSLNGGTNGKGISNLVLGTATPGYATAVYPPLFVKIVGDPEVSAVTGALADDLVVLGNYTGDSSYTYQLEIHGTGEAFRVRKWPAHLTASNATSWLVGFPIGNSTNPTTFDEGLRIFFKGSSYTIGANRWEFTAKKGHTFQYREAGRDWSEVVEITGEVQEVSSGISLLFPLHSGYQKGDQFEVLNRTINSYGRYTGDADAVYTVQVTGSNSVGAVAFVPNKVENGGSLTTGPAMVMSVSGSYEGNTTHWYEVKVVDSISLPNKVQWRKNIKGFPRATSAWSISYDASLLALQLDDGLSVSWGAVSGMTVGDMWTFTAHAGDTFKWRKGAGAWSEDTRITSVGLVEADPSNAGSEVANTDVVSFGEYTGASDATFVVEILQGGAHFRWKKGDYLPSAASHTGTSYGVPYDRGSEPVAFGQWSPKSAILQGYPVHMSDGVYVSFPVSGTGHTHGDTYYIAAKTTKHHRLSDGVGIVFGSPAGYSSGDVWTFDATAAVPARGPLDGNTELVVTGTGFLPTDGLRCKLYDETTLFEMVVPAQYDSPTQVRCRTEAHPPDTLSDPEFIGLGESYLDLGGVYTGGQTSDFIVEVVTATSFRFAIDGALYSNDTAIVGGEWQDLADGIKMRFSSGAYNPGDSWTFKAHYLDTDNMNAHPEVQLGSIKPGVMKHVYVSNDAGVTWSAKGTGLARFLFSDVYVSVSGDDTYGDGTYSLPYRTIQRAIRAALGSPRSSFLYDSKTQGQSYHGAAEGGLSRMINRDSITVMDGRYAGMGNTGLFPMGKMLVISAAHRGNVVIDCEMSTSGDIYTGDRFQAVASTGHATLRGINVDGCSNRGLPFRAA